MQEGSDPGAGPGEREPEEADGPLADFYAQELEWVECGTKECTTFEVPADYDDPGGARLEIAAARLLADGESPLVVNPGGPGGSGIEMAEAAADMFTEDLIEAYDIIGVDPRGVGQSSAIDCVDDADLDQLRAAGYQEGPEGETAAAEDIELIVQGCQERSADLLPYVDTISAARDMEVLRVLLEAPELDYLGYSYGTYLGAHYAELFPERVGRFVLDGGMDPSLERHEVAHDQALGFESAMTAYIEDCLAWTECPLAGDLDTAFEQIRALLDEAEAAPLPTGDGDRVLTRELAYSGIIGPLYNQGDWPVLTESLELALNGDGSYLLFVADLFAGREEDGSYRDNQTEANWAINCLDRPVTGDPGDWDQRAEAMIDAAPTFGPALAYGEQLCAQWPTDSEGTQGEITAAGAAPILVVGTTGDPATPYHWSESLAQQLESGVLLTYDGEGHGAYGRSNSCVNEHVDDFLIRGEIPEDGLVC